MDQQGRLFSNQRLEALLRGARQTTPTELIRDAVSAVRSFAAGEPQADDITLLAVRYLQGRAAVADARAPAAVSANR